jgi:3-deoxy-7-phosphoheptulonate synthase
LILVFKSAAVDQQLSVAQEQLDRLGFTFKLVRTASGCLLIVLDDVSTVPTHIFSQLPGVDKVLRVAPQCSLVLKNGLTAVPVGRVMVGGDRPTIIAGPCSVDGQAQLMHLAHAVKDAGAQMLRGGAFKPRTSPYDFQGLGQEGLTYLAAARAATGLPVVSEIMSAEQIEAALPFVDLLQIGARNMYNYDLLKEAGRTRRPVLLKRGLSATLQEFVNAAEYIMLQGNMQVILCERGIRTFETHTRNTLDLSAVAALKTMTPLPVLVDPSHGTGRRELVRAMSRAAIACGADGLIIEVHQQPNLALSDGDQAITPDALRSIVADAVRIRAVLTETESLTVVPTLPVQSPVALT